VGAESVSAGQLLQQIAAHPEHFNPNVLLRPVVQDYLLPTLAYTGGSAEVAYFAQAGVVYEKLLGRVTPVLPRFSATLVEPKPQRFLERYHLSLPELFAGPEKVREIIAGRSIPPDLQTRFSDVYATLDQSFAALHESLGGLDPTLVDAAQNAKTKIWYQINNLHTRAARAQLLRDEVIARHAEALSGALFPNKALQEREIAGISFVARYGSGLLHDLYAAIRTDCHDHQVLELN
jgi:uncharacterized protein YllA (UPF0747 family)